MKPKLLAAREALDQGAGRVWIGAWNGAATLAQMLAGQGGGTTIGMAETAASAAHPHLPPAITLTEEAL